MSRVFVCADCCCYNFYSSQEIKTHIRQVHSPKAKCPFCYTNFSSIRRFQKHCCEKHQIEKKDIGENLRKFKICVKKQYVIHDPYNFNIPVKQVDFDCPQYLTEFLIF